MLFLGACDINADNAPKGEILMQPSSAQEETPKVEKTMKQVTVLSSILEVLSTPGGANWQMFDEVSAIQWRDNEPVLSDGGYHRAGNILLAGFANVSVPNGKTGIEADSRMGNEGDAGITLNGSDANVQSLSVMKFYPSENYQEIIKEQLSEGVEIILLADQCRFDAGTTTENLQKNKFYQIDLLNKRLIYLEAYVDEEGNKYSPGSTTFVFYRDKPKQQIARMQCHEM